MYPQHLLRCLLFYHCWQFRPTTITPPPSSMIKQIKPIQSLNDIISIFFFFFPGQSMSSKFLWIRTLFSTYYRNYESKIRLFNLVSYYVKYVETEYNRKVKVDRFQIWMVLLLLIGIILQKKSRRSVVIDTKDFTF